MMISVQELRNRVVSRYPQAEIVGETTVRYVREAEDRPFAIYYLDVTQNIPQDERGLASYLDAIVGRPYFDGPKSLQWSNYLYFITTASRLQTKEIRRARELIETDRRYARKFVISEEEIDGVLSPRPVVTRRSTKLPNVFSTWMQLLSEAGIDGAVISDEDLPTKLSMIEQSAAGEPGFARLVPAQPLRLPFIKSLELRNYRRYPLRREFDFGTVNLIFGPNATGKTSLLEAIELYYCGRNKRSGAKPSMYELTVAFANGQVEIADGDRSLNEFRDRNLAWYGQAEVKTNNVYQSFAKFNFLDTDAAVNISESTSNMAEDLSKLLVGPDASKTWQSILRLYEALTSKLRDLGRLSEQISDELSEFEKSAAALEETETASQAIQGRLTKMLRGFGWQFDDGSPDPSAVGDLIAGMAEISALAGQVSSLSWLPAPVTAAALTAYLEEAASKVPEVEQKLSQHERLQHLMRENLAELHRTRKVLELLSEVKSLAAAGVVERQSRRREIQNDSAEIARQLSGLDINELDWLRSLQEALQRNIPQLRGDASQASAAWARDLEAARGEYANFSQLRDETFNLAQQLRSIASELLRSQLNQDECPLCHTQFPTGELANHIAVGLDEDLERAGRVLIGRVSEAEAGVAEADRAFRVVDALLSFAAEQQLPEDATLAAVVERVEEKRNALRRLEQSLSEADAQIALFDSQRLSFEAFEERSVELARLGSPLNETAELAIDARIAEVQDRVSRLNQFAETTARHERDVAQALADLLPADRQPGIALRHLFSQYSERLAVTKRFADRLAELSQSYAWPASKPIAELLVAANEVRSVASQFRRRSVLRGKSVKSVPKPTTASAISTTRRRSSHQRYAGFQRHTTCCKTSRRIILFRPRWRRHLN
jgi:exonuclease SbcC